MMNNNYQIYKYAKNFNFSNSVENSKTNLFNYLKSNNDLFNVNNWDQNNKVWHVKI